MDATSHLTSVQPKSATAPNVQEPSTLAKLLRQVISLAENQGNDEALGIRDCRPVTDADKKAAFQALQALTQQGNFISMAATASLRTSTQQAGPTTTDFEGILECIRTLIAKHKLGAALAITSTLPNEEGLHSPKWRDRALGLILQSYIDASDWTSAIALIPLFEPPCYIKLTNLAIALAQAGHEDAALFIASTLGDDQVHRRMQIYAQIPSKAQAAIDICKEGMNSTNCNTRSIYKVYFDQIIETIALTHLRCNDKPAALQALQQCTGRVSEPYVRASIAVLTAYASVPNLDESTAASLKPLLAYDFQSSWKDRPKALDTALNQVCEVALRAGNLNFANDVRLAIPNHRRGPELKIQLASAYIDIRQYDKACSVSKKATFSCLLERQLFEPLFRMLLEDQPIDAAPYTNAIQAYTKDGLLGMAQTFVDGHPEDPSGTLRSIAGHTMFKISKNSAMMGNTLAEAGTYELTLQLAETLAQLDECSTYVNQLLEPVVLHCMSKHEYEWATRLFERMINSQAKRRTAEAMQNQAYKSDYDALMQTVNSMQNS